MRTSKSKSNWRRGASALVALITAACGPPGVGQEPKPICDLPATSVAIAIEAKDGSGTRVLWADGLASVPDLESLQPLAGVIPGEIVGLGLNETGVYGLTSSGLHGPLENSSAVVVGLAALCPTCGEFIHGPIAINDDWLAVATDGSQSRALWFSSDGSLLASNLVVEDEGTAAGLSADEFGAALVTTNDGRLLRLTSDGERAILHDGLLDGVELTPKNFDYRPDLGFILSGFGWSEPAVWLAGPVPENWVLDSAQFIGGTFSNSEITTFVGDLAWIKVEPFVLAAYVPGTGQQVAVMSLEAIADSESDRVRAVAAPRPRCE